MLNIPDFNTFLDKIKQLTPENIDMLSGEMARDPSAAPPQIGEMGLAGAMDQMQKMMTSEQLATQSATAVTSPLVNQGMNAQGPMDPQQGLASLLAGPQGGAPRNLGGQPQGMDMAKLSAAAQALQTQKQPQQKQSAPFISNLNFGAATPAKGLGLQAPASAGVPGLGAYLGKRG